jgi:hypothetical protein
MRAHLLPGGRWITAMDVAAIVWIAAWAFIALRVSDEVAGLRELSVTAESAGRAVNEVGAALGSLDLPFVGERLDRVAGSVTDAGRRTVDSARASRESVRELRVLLGLSIGLIPVSPLLLIYLPLRVAHARERRALRVLFTRAESDPELARLLERRALEHMSYRRLRDLPGRPWAWDDRDDLAALEADRLGDRRG